jgi:hypothetical protein
MTSYDVIHVLSEVVAGAHHDLEMIIPISPEFQNFPREANWASRILYIFRTYRNTYYFRTGYDRQGTKSPIPCRESNLPILLYPILC